jgi:hypothetical protein
VIQSFIKRFLLRIGMTDEQAEAVSAWLASLFDKAELGPRPMTPDEEREHFDRKTPPLNS